jgi:PhnB protein
MAAKRKARPVPKGYPTVSSYLVVDGAAAAIRFYRRVFGAAERMRMKAPGGKIGHAELRIGTSVVMLADEHPEHGFRGPRAFGGSSVTLHVYVEDVDTVIGRATRAGATLVRPVKDQFYGDRSGTFVDPFGHVWNVATHVEDVPPRELARRMKAAGA